MNSPFTDYLAEETSHSMRDRFAREIEQRNPFVNYVEPGTFYQEENRSRFATVDEINEEEELDDFSSEEETQLEIESMETLENENEWNEKEFYPIYDREADLVQHGLLAEIEEQEGHTEVEETFAEESVVFEGELKPAQITYAISENKKYGTSLNLNWEKNLKEICAIIGVSPAIANLTGINEDFVKAVAAWQQKGSDGVIGPNTWKKLKLILGIRQNNINVTTTPPLKTICVPLVHGAEGKAMPMTAIFIPQGTDKTKTSLNLIIFLHGHKVASGLKVDSTIEDFLIHKDFLIREALNKSDKNVILIAPTLGPLSEAGMLEEHPGFFDAYIDKITELLQDQFYEKKKLSINSIILSAHSGGGKPMLNILRMITSKYVPKINECWGFDSLYQLSVDDFSKFSWKDWLKDPAKKFFHHGVDKVKREACTGIKTADAPWLNANSFKSSTLPNYKAEDSVVCHNNVPVHYLKVRLDSPSSPLPKR